MPEQAGIQTHLNFSGFPPTRERQRWSYQPILGPNHRHQSVVNTTFPMTLRSRTSASASM